ncbi:MAG: SH3 domain-containing protein [Verrucomicrobia bacterium]|nr:SH3 domain-containing protein [Verrucomicrobiota bacterium]
MSRWKLLTLAIAVVFGAAAVLDGAAAAGEIVESADGLQESARTGEVNAHEVNVRAGAHLNYEILTQLDKGDLVLVTGTRGEWTRIAMPPGVLAWVSTDYVAEDGLVEAANVNVRSGAALDHIVLCQLPRDAQVIIRTQSADGKWYGIEPPETAYAWIASELVDDKGDASLYTEWAPRKAKCLALLASADRFRNYELKQPEAKIRFDAMLENYARIETSYADMPEARTAKMRLREIERIRKDVEQRLGVTRTAEQAGISTDTTPTSTDTATPTTDTTPPESEVKYLKATGVLYEISKESTRKGLYRITKDERWVCIVTSGTIDLGSYAGKSVEVIGTEAPSEGWSLRTINVQRIKLLE